MGLKKSPSRCQEDPVGSCQDRTSRRHHLPVLLTETCHRKLRMTAPTIYGIICGFQEPTRRHPENRPRVWSHWLHKAAALGSTTYRRSRSYALPFLPSSVSFVKVFSCALDGATVQGRHTDRAFPLFSFKKTTKWFGC